MKNKSLKERMSIYMSRKTEAGKVHYLHLTKRPSYTVVQKIRLRLDRYRISSRSAETAFYLLLALVPFLIFLISLFGLLSESIPFRTDVLLVLQDTMPAPVFSFISDILGEIIASQNITFLSISMLGFIWASSKGFTVILQGLNQIYSTKKSVNPILLRILGLLFALLLVLALMISIILITFGDLLFQQIAVWSGQTVFSGTFLHIIRYVVSFTFLFVVFSLLHYLASHRKGGFFRAMPGAAFTASCWIFFSFAVSWYVNHFGQFSKLYGSLTGIIVLMVWLYFCCLTILTGAIIHELILERYISRRISG
ncbi:MAG: YihY/virulence factor BrkB family protein [Eubacteriales bacterium]